MSAAGAPRTRLSTYLLRVTAATLLPLLVFALIAGWLLARHERATFELGAQERVRALSSALDAELRGAIATALALAQTNALRAADLEAFRRVAQRVKLQNPQWLSVNLALPDAPQSVIDVLQVPGTERPLLADRASFEAVLTTQRPAVGDLVAATATQPSEFSLRVPVIDEGRTRYVLSAVLDPSAVQQLLVAQRFPADWVGVVVDRHGRVVARTLKPEATVGNLSAPSLRQAIAGAREGYFRGITLEGAEVYTPFFTSAFSGWSVAIGVPATAVEAGAQRALWNLLAGVAIALLIALALSLWLGRRIAAPIAALGARAYSIAAGDHHFPGRPVQAPVIEIAHLAAALDQAAASVQARAATLTELAAVTGNASLALFMLDERQCCSFMNPAAEAMTGYTLDEVRGRPLREVVQPALGPGAGRDWPIGRASFADSRQAGEDRFVHRSGRSFAVAYTASPIRRDGVAVGTVVEARDISEQQRAEAERAELLVREQAARADAEAANRSKDEFLAMLGHELRNPLGAISNAVHLAARTRDSEQAVRAQQVIARQVTHMTRLVDDLLDAARVASGKIVLSRAPIDLAEVVRRCVATQAQRASDYTLDLDLQPAWVDGDETRLEQVVGNLLGNALRYTPHGGRIGLRLREDGGDAVFEVSDNGIGIPSDLVPRLFDLFVQGSRGLERSQGGLGLGLTLVRRLTELHGGRVDAASAGPQQGSTFTVRLPRIGAPSPESPAEPALAAAKGSASDARRVVLVVEDNEDIRASLVVVLELSGHRVIERTDGASGVDAALALDPDVALIDIGLPGLSGYDVARRLRDAGHAGMLLVALTGYGQPEDRARSIAAGFDLHATKPVDVDWLLRTIARWPAEQDAG